MLQALADAAAGDPAVPQALRRPDCSPAGAVAAVERALLAHQLAAQREDDEQEQAAARGAARRPPVTLLTACEQLVDSGVQVSEGGCCQATEP
jgi:hypothetical protein